MEIGVLQLLLAVVTGVAVGLFYFGGLWFTIKRAASSQRPHLLMLGSLVLRALIAAGVIFLVGRAHWQMLVAVMACFLITRSVLVRRIGNPPMPTMSAPDDADAENGTESEQE